MRKLRHRKAKWLGQGDTVKTSIWLELYVSLPSHLHFERESRPCLSKDGLFPSVLGSVGTGSTLHPQQLVWQLVHVKHSTIFVMTEKKKTQTWQGRKAGLRRGHAFYGLSYGRVEASHLLKIIKELWSWWFFNWPGIVAKLYIQEAKKILTSKCTGMRPRGSRAFSLFICHADHGSKPTYYSVSQVENGAGRVSVAQHWGHSHPNRF